MAFHRLENGNWEEDSKTPNPINVMKEVFTAVGREFPYCFVGGKFSYMEGTFTAEEQAIIKQLLEDNGAV